MLKLPSWPSKHLCATRCGLVTNIAVSLHANITVGLVADIIAVRLLADITVSLHATHGGLDRHLGSLGIEQLIFSAWFCFKRIGCIICLELRHYGQVIP
jgi:hypothetical protein